MPRKRTNGFEKMPIAQQQEVIDRFKYRGDVREANKKLAKQVLTWLTNRPEDIREFMELFEAAGHAGEYHEDPSDTTQNRVMAQAAELQNILKRLEDTPLDYSGVIELSYVYDRILMMMETLDNEPRGTMERAIELYRTVGEAIRRKVFNETGHYPEEFPIPRGRITGREKSDQFKVRDHQPPLF